MNVSKSYRLFVVAAVLSFFCILPYSTAQQYGQQIEAALDRAEKASAAGKYADAVKEYKEANKLEKNACFDCYLGLASAYAKTGDFSHADDSAAKAISLAKTAKDQSVAHTVRGSVLMHFGSEDGKQFAAAEAEFRQALSADSTNPQARFDLGVCLMKQKRDDEGIRELKTFIASFPNVSVVHQAELLISNPRRAREWFAPDFNVNTLQGQTLSLHELTGKVVVLDFWATWCPPCRESLPEIKDLLKKYPREKLAVISVSGDDDEAAWKEFVAKKNMDWPQVLGKQNRQIEKAFGVHAFPTYIVIDGEGVVRQRIVGLNPQQSIAARLKDTLKTMKELN